MAEPKRRRILEYFAPTERAVGDIATALGLAQPSVSKHLDRLRQVDLVGVRRDGRHTLYRANPDALTLPHEWVESFEQYSRRQVVRATQHAEISRPASDR